MNKIQNITHSQYTHKVVEFIFSNSWFVTVKFREHSNISEAVTARIIRVLTENSILNIVRKSSGRKPSMFFFSKLFKIVK